MARDFIIEEVRAIAWTMRLRDPATGESVDVPMTPGERFTPPAGAKNGGANDRQHAAPAPTVTSTSTAPESPVAAEPTHETDADADTDDKKEEATPRRRKRRKGPRASKKTEAPGDAAGEPPPPTPSATSTEPANHLETPEGRRVLVDESTLTVDDRAAWDKLRGLYRKGNRAGKRGDLGWEETTEEGRSGIFARWGKGQFKILHAGNDTYALFYEWDGGKWERLACGGAEDLMKLAAVRAEEEIPAPPLTTLNLEHARLLCGTPAQQAAAKKRLEPVFQEVERPERSEARLTRARTATPKAGEPPAEAPVVPPTPTPAPSDATAAMDAELMSSFNAELDKVLGEEDD
jgi:hypothetical protein